MPLGACGGRGSCATPTLPRLPRAVLSPSRHGWRLKARVAAVPWRIGGRYRFECSDEISTPGVHPLKIVTVGLVAGAVLLSGCSRESEQQQSSTQNRTPLGEQASKQTEEKAWADALAAGSVAAFNAYLQNYGAGAHAAEARARLATLEAQARREADEKAWADASRSGTAAAFNAYLRDFASGAHVAQARARVAALEEQARKDADEKAWEEATHAGTKAQYEAYLRSFGDGGHAVEARDHLAALEAQARKDADDKAWAEAVRSGTTESLNSYLQSFPNGTHVAEARERVSALEVQARKEADEKAWAEALRTGGIGAFQSYLQNFATGAHAAEAKARIAKLDQQARQVPKVDIENTCRAGESVLSGLSSADSSRTNYDACMDSEQGARNQIIKDWTTFSAAEQTRCVQPKSYLPSYVEWLTCLEMERDVRKFKQGSPATVGRQ